MVWPGYERESEHFLAFVAIACALLCYRRPGWQTIGQPAPMTTHPVLAEARVSRPPEITGPGGSCRRPAHAILFPGRGHRLVQHPLLVRQAARTRCSRHASNSGTYMPPQNNPKSPTTLRRFNVASSGSNPARTCVKVTAVQPRDGARGQTQQQQGNNEELPSQAQSRTLKPW